MSTDTTGATLGDGVVVGVDLGGTRLKAARVQGDDTVERRTVVAVGDRRSEAAVVALLAETAETLDPGGNAPIGVAVAGVIEGATRTLRESPNFPLWKDFRLAERLEAATGRLVHLENDANAAIFGEAAAGAGHGAPSVIGLTLGTGVGGALVLDGDLWRGERGMAGELGHITIVPDGRPCGCGNRGCLERYAGALGIAETMRAHPAADAAWLVAAADRDGAVAWLARQADAGDARAAEVFGDVGRALGQALAGLVHALDVRRIVLTGGVSRAFSHFAPAMEAELTARTFRSMREGVGIIPGTLGDDAALIGASVLARHRARG
jgi:glucokinase